VVEHVAEIRDLGVGGPPAEERHPAKIQRIVIVAAGARRLSVDDRIDHEKRDDDDRPCQQRCPQQVPVGQSADQLRLARHHEPDDDRVDYRAFPAEKFVDDKRRGKHQREPQGEAVGP
jgi:hypothetical protein